MTATKDFSDDRLRYLFEAHRLGTLRAASEYLNVAASSMSRQIASLEKQLGTVLTEKGRHTVQLTAAGRLVLEYYQSRLSQREELIAAVNDIRGLKQGHLTIAAGQDLLRIPLVRTLREFSIKWPAITIAVQSVPTRDVIELVRNDRAHFGIILESPDDPRINTRAAIDQPLCLIVFPSHPLAHRKSVSIREVADQRLLLPEPGFRLRQILNRRERSEALLLNTVITASAIQILIDCVMAEIGVTILPESCVLHSLESGKLISVPFVDPDMRNSQVHIVSRVGRQLPKAALLFMDILKRQAIRALDTAPVIREELADC
ncbi:MAG: LysR family transcriptional regulator [Burkholderiaceae bacterium]|nr:LysR family transcriptional regulator [Burkholderiaceae bacterium]